MSREIISQCGSCDDSYAVEERLSAVHVSFGCFTPPANLALSTVVHHLDSRCILGSSVAFNTGTTNRLKSSARRFNVPHGDGTCQVCHSSNACEVSRSILRCLFQTT